VTAGPEALPAAVVEALRPLATRAATGAVLTDFDGTVAAIVPDPATAVPLPGAVEVLARVADRYACVAVVSGRPVAFLRERIPVPGVRLVGLYGLEWAQGSGPVHEAEGAATWRPVVAAAAARLAAAVPDGAVVEPKDLALAVHWRRVPAAGAGAEDAARREAARSGLVAHPGRRSVELRPPLAVDKGTAVLGLLGDVEAACFLGDDLGDLPAFEAVTRWGATPGHRGITVAAVDGESAPEVVAAAGHVVDGPAGALDVLGWLADHAGESSG
jgi:trehalose 6-phosphate phosphatase